MARNANSLRALISSVDAVVMRQLIKLRRREYRLLKDRRFCTARNCFKRRMLSLTRSLAPSWYGYLPCYDIFNAINDIYFYANGPRFPRTVAGKQSDGR